MDNDEREAEMLKEIKRLREEIRTMNKGYIVPEPHRQILIYKALLSLSVNVMNEQMRMNPLSESYDDYENILNRIADEISILAELKKK